MNIKTVVLDFGHGGSDPGAINGLHLEKDKTLKIGLEVKRLLEKQNIKVVCTRESDIYVSLSDRALIENKANADCCVSLHLDAATSSASGMTVWLHSQAPVSYVKWANSMLTELKDVGYKSNRYQEVNKGYQGNPNVDYAWNRQTKSPSMLLELGFITNEDNLRDFESKHKNYAIAIAKSICGFIGVKYVEQDIKTIYRVQVGAFSKMPNAASLQKDLISRGYDAFVTVDGFYRVQVGAFSILTNAQALSKKLLGDGYPNIIKQD